MRALITLALVLLFTLPAYGGEGGGISMLVIDTDPKGTNVREAPGGAVAHVIPYGGKTDAEIEMRRVNVTEERNGQWFRVRLADKSAGWMHASVLGSCASATEDGDAPMYAEPDENSARLATVQDGTPLRLLDVRGIWAKMEYTEASGKKQAGWIMEQALFSNPYNSCW
jgi:SH3-like domain-containing protein